MKGVYAFLRAVRGDWRNAVAINCGCCPYKTGSCEGFLLAADPDGRPLLLHAGAVRAMSGECLDLSECSAQLSLKQFQTLYASWLLWNTESSDECGLRQAADKCGLP